MKIQKQHRDRDPNHHPNIKRDSSWLGRISLGARILAAAVFAPLTAVNAQDAMRFPVDSDGGVLSVEWKGGEARAGQAYQYTMSVKNLSKVAAHDVVVHQTLPGDFKVTESSPRAEQTAGDRFTPAGKLAQDEAARRRSAAADAADQQRDRENPRPLKDDRGNAQDANNKSKNSAKDGSAAERNRAEQAGQGNQDSEADGRKPQKQGQQQAQVKRWRVGTIEPGQSQEVRVTGLPRSAGQVQTCVWVTFQPTYCINLTVVEPQLELTQQILDLADNSRTTFYECETVIVRYKLTNPGSGATDKATLTVALPEGMKTEDDQSLKIEVGALAPGESVERKIRINPEATGTFNMSATASTGALEASSGTDAVEIVRPELELTVKVPDKAYLGRSLSYEVEVRNNSDVPALDTVVLLPVPTDALRLASSGKRIDGTTDTFSLGRIDGGSSKSFAVSFDPSYIGDVKFEAVARAYCAVDVTQKVSTAVEGIPALQIFVVDRQDPVKIGEETIYEIKVRNEGTGEDIGIQLTGELPKTLEFIKADGDSKVDGMGTSLKFGKIDRLEPGEVASWLVTVKGTGKGRGALKIQMQSDAVKDVTSSEPTTVF